MSTELIEATGVFQRQGVDHVTKQEVTFYHPCSYETYRKLKELNRILSEIPYMQAADDRFERKLPHNRVWKKAVVERNHHGEVTKEITPAVPMQKPPLTKLPWGVISTAYYRARTPCATQDMVKPLGLSEKAVDELLAKARLWWLDVEAWKEYKKEAKKRVG